MQVTIERNIIIIISTVWVKTLTTVLYKTKEKLIENFLCNISHWILW